MSSTYRFLTLTGAVLLALRPCSCQALARTAPEASGSLADALAAAHATSTGNTAEERRANAAATKRAALLWFAQSGALGKPLTVQGPGRTWTLSASWPENLLFDELIAPTPVRGDGSEQVLRDGIGAPLIAHWRPTPERKARHPFMAEGGYIAQVTATLEFRGQNAALRLHDPRIEQTAVVAGRRQALAADFSAPGRWMLEEMKRNKQLGMSGISAMRHTDEYLSKMGLITLEPPSRDRIPAILTHGLMSRPITWQRVYEALSADPGIARKYQFYFFRYPSGVPVVYSAAKCREQLTQLKRELVRTGNTVHRNRMILIGHSMGGLVSKTQIQSSGDRLWITTFGEKPENLNLSDAELKTLRPLVEFEPNPDVSRVVFVCTPHRGSKMAEGFIGRMGRRLIELPFTALGGAISLLQSSAPSSPIVQRMRDRGVPSSIDNLSPDSLYVKTAMQLPIKRGVRLHSIIGNRKGLPLDDPKCSDGAVPYSSAHLDNVESELVVRSGHSAHECPEAIAELRRILLLHAVSSRRAGE